MTGFPSGDMRAIHRRWSGSLQTRPTVRRVLVAVVGSLLVLPALAAPAIDLTAEEKAWLAAHPRIRIGPAPNFPPIEFLGEEGEHRGLAADYRALLEKRLGITFEIVRRSSWAEVVESTRRGEIDVWLEAYDTPERREWLLFTRPYLVLPGVIIVRREQEGHLELADLDRFRVVAVEGYGTTDHLREAMPQLPVVLVPTIAEGLERVAFGSADAIVVSMPAASYFIDQMGLANLRVAGRSGFEGRLAMASRRDWPLLHDILQKGLDSIGEDERREIQRRWISLEEPVRRRGWLGWAGMALPAFLGLVLALWVWWSRRKRASAAGEGPAHRRRSMWLMYAIAAVVVLAVSGLAWMTSATIEKRLRTDQGRALRGVLGATSQGLYQWFGDRETEARGWATRPGLLQAYQALLQPNASPDPVRLDASRRLVQEQLGGLLQEGRHAAFLLVDGEGRVVASSRDRPAGEVASDLSASLLESILSGGQASGVGLPHQVEPEGAGSVGNLLAVAAAVPGDGPAPSGALVLLIDPAGDFTDLLWRGNLGATGQTYAFDHEGRLLSRSRYEEQLRQAEVLQEGEISILRVEVRDPGENVTQGARDDSHGVRPLTHMAAAATRGQAGMDLEGYRDYRGVPVIGAWVWDRALGLGIATEVDAGEAYGSLRTIRGLFQMATALTVALILALTLSFSVFETHRARISARLHQSEERIRLLLESVGDGIFGTDRAGRVDFVNPAALRMLGWEAGDLLGKKIHSLVHHTRADGTPYPAEECPMHRAYAEGKSAARGDEVLWRKDGTSFPAEYSSQPVRREGEVTGSVVVFRDISQRKAAEAQLHLQAQALDAAANGIAITDRGGTLLWVNAAFTELTGYAYDEAVGQNPRVLRSGQHPPEFYREMWRTILAGEVWSGEVVNRRKDGSLYTEEMTITPVLDPDGEILNFVAIKKDITERKAMEEQLERARLQAVAASRAKSEFLASMSHELRTPLNGVLGYAQILQRDPDVSRKQQERLLSIERCGSHLLGLINDVLDLSKIEAGRLEVEKGPTDLQALIQGITDIIRPRAVGSSLQFEVTVAPEVPRGLLTDGPKLRQILVNLLGNAVKFTRKGSVSLEVGPAPENRLQFVVRDTGDGISPEQIEAIFQPFKQAEAGREHGGTGLGLAISRRLARALGGEIQVESEPGVGSCFTVLLPADEAEVAQAEASEAGAWREVRLAPGQSVTVLVADDSATNREILVALLEGGGFQTVTAVNGEDALARLREHRMPLVLMDVRMPVMGGPEATRILRQDPDLRDTVVIAVTASVMSDQKEQIMESGFDDFLGKPFRAEELFGLIGQHLGVELETAEPAAAGPAESGPLPPELASEIASRLRAAAEDGDISAVTAIGEELESGESTGGWGARILELAGGFDFDGIEQLASELERAEAEA